MSPVPFGRRDRLIREVGPDASGSYPGFAWTHSPEKSGTGAAVASPLGAGPAVGRTACPKAGVAAAAASVTTRRKFRHCKSICVPPLSGVSAGSSGIKLHPLHGRLEGAGDPWVFTQQSRQPDNKEVLLTTSRYEGGKLVEV